MTDKFLEFLEEKADLIHAETWKHFDKGSHDPDWLNAKDRENLIGEIIRKYKEICGDMYGFSITPM